MVTRKLRIRGRVQGVGYRYALQEAAERLAVTGWVRNRSDGSVEALLQGEVQSIEAVIAWARRGPPAARVAEVRVDPGEAADAQPHAGFALRPSA
jgi:acylphosphatase